MTTHAAARVRNKSLLLVAAIAAPTAVAVVFVSMYALSTPLTDEWLLVHNAMVWQAAPDTMSGIIGSWYHMRWFIYEHPIIIPNLIYLLIMPHLHYDTRALVAITLICFLALVWVSCWRTKSHALGIIAASLLAFSPSHYMEYFWGFQFAFAMSTTLAIAGLGLIDFGMKSDHESVRKIAIGFVVICCGFLCSAGAALGFLAAIVLCLNGDVQRNRRLGIGIVAVVLFAAAIAWRHGARLESDVGFKNVLMVLTAIGSVLYSSPVGMGKFGVDPRSVAGAVVVLLDLLLIWRVVKRGAIGVVIFPCALIAFGGAAIGTVTLARDYIGNWHLQLVLPLLVGSALLAGTAVKSGGLGTKALGVAMLVVLATGALGYVRGFHEYGPAYRLYAERVTQYMKTLPQDPGQPKPFPETGGWDATPQMTSFLMKAGNPAFK